jgi:GNAT superfamily N-acetyltransferase
MSAGAGGWSVVSTATPEQLAIERFDPLVDDEALQQWAGCVLASSRHVFGDRHTAWSGPEVRESARVDDTSDSAFLLARRGGAAAGAARISMPMRDNLYFADLELDVHPEHRRIGVGSALLHALEQIAAEHARTSLRVESSVGLGDTDAADPFAARHGYRTAQVDLRSDLELTDDLAETLSSLEREAALFAGDYDVLTWWDDVPELWRAERARCAVHMSTDAPSGDVDIEQEDWDAERIGLMVDQLHAQGRRFVETVAVHRPSRRMVGFTDLVVPEHAPEMAFQWDTLVLAGHRGHRLGQLVKAANLRALHRELPDVGWVCTWNAESNEPMLRVNRAMGFRPVGRTVEWLKQTTPSKVPPR